MLDDTIAAIATSPGRGGVGIVRISGVEAIQVARRVFPRFGGDVEDRRLLLGDVVRAGDDGAVLDRALGVIMRGPRSFTGEDVAELHCHGGALNLGRVLDAVLAAGARAALPGEFSRRAFLNGRMDLAQAEAIDDIAGARTLAALEAAQGQLSGALSARVDAIRDHVAAALARLEVNIDFSHEDVPVFELRDIATDCVEARHGVMRLAATFEHGRILREGLHVAIAGRPNVGKSSIFNALLRSNRAIVTDVPGTTRDLIEEHANLGGLPVVLVDTAGLREAPDPVEREGVSRARARIAEADVVLCVYDGSQPPCPEDGAARRDAGDRAVVEVLNKADLGRAPGWDETARRALAVSATHGTGLEALERAALSVAGLGDETWSSSAIVTRARHRAALDRCSDSLGRAAEAARTEQPHEIVAFELQLALEALGDIVGATTAEDVLDRIFAEFCIGK